MGTKMCRISARTTLVFDPKMDIPDFLVLFMKKVFPNGGTLARLGPMGPNRANVPPFGKTFFIKSTKKSGMSIFGSKTKVVRAEILHILVPIPSRGDP